MSEITIKNVLPIAALPGGEVTIEYEGPQLAGTSQPQVRFGDFSAQVTLASSERLVAKVPEPSAETGTSELIIATNGDTSRPFPYEVGKRLASSLYPVGNPAIDTDGNVYATYSGRRGQKTPVSIYKITPKGAVTPFVTDIVNATGLAFSLSGDLFVSSRFEGNVYRVDPSGRTETYIEGMGVATGIAFDREGNLYVGDRSGSIFKISPNREIFVFATLEPSIAAYHLTFGFDEYLYVAGPTTSSFDSIYRISPSGEVSRFFTGLGRPQGLAFDIDGTLYAVASYRGRRGVFQFRDPKKPELVVAGLSLVGLAFDVEENLMIVDLGPQSGSLYRVHLGITGKAVAIAMLAAEIIAIGSELLMPQFRDTNSLYLTEQLNAVGIPVVMKGIVGDEENYLEQAIRGAMERTPILITIGGLGPTEDDLTRKVVARVMQRQLVLNDDILARLQRRFKARGIDMPPNNARQALVPTGAEILENKNGTAPGLWLKTEKNHVILLPGPPSELKPMFEASCMPRLHEMAGGIAIARCVYRTACLFESALDQRIAPIYTKYKNIETTVLAKPGQVEVRLTARGKNKEEAERIVRELGDQIDRELQEYIFARSEESLEEVVGALLTSKSATISVAESCTGGLLAHRLTSVSGSSRYFMSGIVTYSNESKMELAGIPPLLLEMQGAVSAEIAQGLAEGVRQRANTTIGVGITGVAGPTGGSEAKPVGTVHVAVATPAGTAQRQFLFPGDREKIRWQASQAGLDMVRRELLRM